MNLPDAVIVLGANGFIGRNLIEALAGRVEFLVGVNRTGAPVEHCHASFAAKRLDELCVLPKRTALINVAALRYQRATFATDQPAIWSANVAITDLAYRFAIARGITELRVAGSSAVYPAAWELLDDAIALDLNAWPHDGEAPYAWTKRWAEITADLWHRHCGISTLTFRLTNPYGPHDTCVESEAHVATAFAIRAVAGDGPFVIHGNPDAERDFVYVGDVADVFIRSLALSGEHTAVNLAFGVTTRIADLAQAAVAAAGRERPLRIDAGAAAGVRIRRATASRLPALLPGLPGFCPVASGMAQTVDWYRHALR